MSDSKELAELQFRSKSLLRLGVVDIDKVDALLRAAYVMGLEAASERRVNDYATIMRIIKSFAELELATMPQKVLHKHDHKHAHAHLGLSDVPDATRDSIAEITDRLAAPGVVHGSLPKESSGGD